MKKSIVLTLLSLLLVVTVTACAGQKEADKTASPEKTVNVTPEKTATPVVTATATPEPTVPKTPQPTKQPGTGQYAEGIADEANGIKFYLDKEDPSLIGGTHINADSSASIQFFPTTTFDKIHIRLCTWTVPEGHTIEVLLYRWMGSYDDTLKGEPVFRKEYADYADNVWLEVQLDKVYEDGEYLVDIVNISGAEHVGLWTSEEEHDMQIFYLDGYVEEGRVAQFAIGYTKTPNKKYGPLSDPGI